MSQYPIRDNNNCFNNTNYVWNNCTVADDRSPLLAWLSPLEPKLRHRDIQERRTDNVGEWLLQTEEFRSWHDWSGEGGGQNAVLFGYGDPGVGKTFISSLVVDNLCDRARGQKAAVTCFYFDFADRKEQSATSALGSLLRQVVGGLERIPEEISQAFQEERNAIGGRGPRLQDIVRMLQAITSSLPTFVCIDALDECTVPDRAKLINSLQQILKTSPRTRVLIVGRPHIQDEIEKALAGHVTSISISPRKGDIIGYLRVKLAEDPTPHARNKSLEGDILEKIPQNMSETFLLISLSINAILHESTIHRRRERLNRMTNGLGVEDVYSATIERIKAQDGDQSTLGMAALMWISHAERPLQADELCHALAVELGSKDFNVENVPSISTLVSCCQGLITVDKEASTARLVHFTLQEYLSTHPDIFTTPHSAIAEICLTYLNSRQVKALSTIPSSSARNAPFLEYSSVYWGVHAKKELSGYGRSLALELLKEDYGQIPTKLLLAQKYYYLNHPHTFYPFSGLHCASFFGIVEVVDTLMEMEYYDINEGDFLGHTPLSWAAGNGHEKVVKILLRREEVNPNKPSNGGTTPLFNAASSGHEGVVKMLLEWGEVNPGNATLYGITPLMVAAWNGHEGVVKILLGQKGVNPDAPDADGRTPLSFAAKYGHEGVVKILLGREEVNPDQPDYDGRTPLSHAASNGHEGIVKILLGREDTSFDKPDECGRTPLWWAARNGHEGVVKILLGWEKVNPDKPDNEGRTLLSIAAESGNEGVVKMLLGLGEVNPDKPDNDGRTPLSFAAWNGHEAVVKILLEREEISPDKPDNGGRTPLSFATDYERRRRIDTLLLMVKGVNPNKPDKHGQTPLSIAAKGRERVVEMLLEREEVYPDKPDNNGRTPLSFAAEHGYERMVEILLGREEVNPDKPNNDGQTPLSIATKQGHEKVVALLQSRQVVIPRTI